MWRTRTSLTDSPWELSTLPARIFEKHSIESALFRILGQSALSWINENIQKQR